MPKKIQTIGSDSLLIEKENLTFTIIKKTIVYGLIIIGIMFLGIKNYKAYILGFVFGTSISILGFKLLDNTIKKAVTMDPSKAYGYSIAHYFLRYTIYFIVLLISAMADYLSFPTTVLGLFMIKIVIVISTIYDSIIRKTK